jgi:hypothetical protein
MSDDPERMATRTLFTGERVSLWTDGGMSIALHYVAGCPRGSRDKKKAKRLREIGWAEISDLDELPALCDAAAWAVDRDEGDRPDVVRKRWEELLRKAKRPTPEWTVEEQDWRGGVVSRSWCPHRLSAWGGWAVQVAKSTKLDSAGLYRAVACARADF